jgi:hypothetical protein
MKDPIGYPETSVNNYQSTLRNIPEERKSHLKILSRYEDNIKIDFIEKDRVMWVPVTTAWRVLGLRMEERPPVMEGSCEYIE